MEGCVTVSVLRLGITVEASLMKQLLCNSVQELGYVWSGMTSKPIRLIVKNCLIIKTVNRPVASYIRVVGLWKKFSLALLAICFTTTFVIHMQKVTVSTDSNHNCFSKRTFWK